MSDLTEIKRISDMTGATFSDAKNAYYNANGDFSLAVSSISGGSYSSASGTRVINDASSWFEKFLASEFTLFTKSDRSVSLPLIMAAVIGLVCIEFIIPVLLIAFLCGVGYKLHGPLFRNDVIISLKGSSDTVNTETARAYDYREEFRKQEARRKEQEAQRAQSVRYEMPPKYEYANVSQDRGYTRNETPQYRYDQSVSGSTRSDPDEEKGFF